MINNINNIFSNYTPYINGWESFKRASITVPLVEHNGSLHILFEVRAKTLKSQPNEICFPGGKIENSEKPLNAALRETYEEIGVNESNISVISPLDVFISPFNILIHPYLIFIKDISKIKLNSFEVEKIFLVPLDYLISNDPQIFINTIKLAPHTDFPYDLIPNKREYKFGTGIYEIPFYTYNQYVIWGLTAKILFNFLSILKQRNYQY